MPPELDVKVVPPWRTAAYNLFTVSLYSLRWYYRVNREIRDFGAVKGDPELAGCRPGWALVAVSLGRWLIIPPFVGYLGFGRRVERCERLTGARGRNPRVVVALLIVTSYIGLIPLHGRIAIAAWVAVVTLRTAALALGQARMNRLWRRVLASEATPEPPLMAARSQA